MHPLLLDRIAGANIAFPEVSDLSVNEDTFFGISYNRKTEGYRLAIEIARLLLLNFHPDLEGGREYVLALLFDMNVLWEKYLYVQLKKQEDTHFRVREQVSKRFWRHKTIRPDIVVNVAGQNVVLDAKWKVINSAVPSDNDLKQMFVYNHHFDADRSILLYPKVYDLDNLSLPFELPKGEEEHYCQLAFVDLLDREKQQLDAQVGQRLRKLVEGSVLMGGEMK